MRLLLGAALAAVMFAGCATNASTQSASSAQAAMAMPEIAIYHLENRRSERIVWLMEELGLPYKLVFTRGNLAASMPRYTFAEPIAIFL